MVHCAVAPIVVVVGLHSCGGWWWWLRSTKGTLRVPLFTLVCSIAAKTTAEEDGGRSLARLRLLCGGGRGLLPLLYSLREKAMQ